jgi:phosphoglycolate phosphatase
MSAAPLVVFDLDGTLIDTAPDLIDTLNAVYADHGVPTVSMDAGRALVGAGVKPLIAHGLAFLGRPTDAATVDELYGDYVARYAARIARLSRPFDGLAGAMDDLQAAGMRFAVCTNKLDWLSVKLLTELGLLPRFEVVMGPNGLGTSKPDPQALLRTIERCGADPRRAVMVGDSRADIEVARNAGVPSVGVTFGYTPVPMADLNPDRLIAHFAALPDAVHGLLTGREAGRTSHG